ncbi:MAG: aspartate ammonia-lyase [Bradymonadales bacterium]|jgi:aspartate ammonia-lyase
MAKRWEHDIIGELEIDADALWGVHTQRSLANFPLTGRRVHSAWIRAMGAVKRACAECSHSLGAWKDDERKARAIIEAAKQMQEGALDDAVCVDSLQGGAGTSLNMNVNEVLANRALQMMGKELGQYQIVSPLDDINFRQSTNDVCPTALKLALVWLIDACVAELLELEQSFRRRSRAFKDVVKMGRTQFQDAVLTTLGIEMKAYSEVIARDAARLERAKEALFVLNLGGTAIGTSIGASAEYVRGVVPVLASITGLPLVQAHDLVDATQNLDAYVLVSSALKSCALSLMKIASDLRFMSSGPQAGIGELRLPVRQAGSSIMPGKVNPVITEAMSQVCMLIVGHDTTISVAASSGNMELNAYLPLIGDCLLNDLELLKKACVMFYKLCVDEMQANVERCKENVQASTSVITSMVPLIGYDRACALGEEAIKEGKTVREKLLESGLVTKEQLDAFVSVEAVYKTMADKDRSP